MCERFVLKNSISEIEDRFLVKRPLKIDWTPGVIVKPGDRTAIISQQETSRITFSAFGMTPSWSKYSISIVNARAEGEKNPNNDPQYNGSKAIFLDRLFQKPLFSQRCIVLVDAFIEISPFDQKPYLFFLPEFKKPFGLAGLYDIWVDPTTEEAFHSFCVITVPANSLIRKIGASRMPVILPRGKESRWLKQDNSLSEILGMLKRFPSEEMNAYPISKDINGPGPFNKDILLPKGEKLLSETEFQDIPRQNHYSHKKKTDVSHWLGNTPI